MLTVDDLKSSCTMRQEMHINGGAAWFGYGYRCVQHPRLRRVDRYDRKTKAVTSQWFVDDEPRADLDAAVAALNLLPEVTAADLAVLAHVSDDYAKLPKEIGWTKYTSPREKGLIEFEAGLCRLTQAGREAKARSMAEPAA